jgi:hypothetical protein
VSYELWRESEIENRKEKSATQRKLNRITWTVIINKMIIM